jgi:hypothetical protein
MYFVGKMQSFFNVKVGGTYSNHCAQIAAVLAVFILVTFPNLKFRIEKDR